MVICEKNGDIVASISGPGTNHWMIGIPECAKRISNMVDQAKIVANIPLTLKLKALGLSLSGCEQVDSIIIRKRNCFFFFRYDINII